MVWQWVLAWALLTLSAGLAHKMITLLITDEIEKDVPLRFRPSLRMFKSRQFPLREVRFHARMYPTSQLRVWWWISAIAYNGLFLGGLLWAVVRNIRPN